MPCSNSRCASPDRPHNITTCTGPGGGRHVKGERRCGNCRKVGHTIVSCSEPGGRAHASAQAAGQQPHPHALAPRRASCVCDVCGEDASLSMHCARCSWDECEACYAGEDWDVAFLGLRVQNAHLGPAPAPPPPGARGRAHQGEGNPAELAPYLIPRSALTLERGALGRGGFGTVVRGTFRGEAVAVKKLALHSPDHIAMFRKEAAVTFATRHAHLVLCHGACVAESEGLYAIVMELCQGTLEEHLGLGGGGGGGAGAARAAVGMPARLRLLRQVAQALAFLHAGGIAHLDIKPGNVLIGEGGVAKVSDLGLARVLRGGGAGGGARRDSSGLGQRGTSGYMDPAPGVIQGATFGPPSDVYSMGIMAWECLSGRAAFEDMAGLPSRAFERRIEDGARPNVALLPGTVPPALAALVPRCWAMEPRQRPSMAEVLAAFGAP